MLIGFSSVDSALDTPYVMQV
ncbi:hypothetical protein V12B01_13495 [Vibrio splendidus 12B01]|nr:hypothetical protein V12B01_13495 [Vibrio splendidus 12B01]